MIRASLVGKLATRADFVRLGPIGPSVLGFEQWLAEAHARVADAGLTSWRVDRPVRGIFRADCFASGAGEDAARKVHVTGGVGAVGALGAVGGVASAPRHLHPAPVDEAGLYAVVVGPSCDAVGRAFPVAVLAALDARAARELPLLPTVLERLFAALERIVASAASGADTSRVGDELAALPPVADDAYAWARTIRERVLGDEPTRAFTGRVFRGTARESAYAIRTLATAIDRVARGERAITVECPIHIDVDLFAWLEMFARRCSPRLLPSVAWTETPPRMLASFGALPPTLLLELISGRVTSSQTWPLVTDREPAIDSAVSRLGAAFEALAADESRLEDLVRVVGALR